MQKRSSGSVRIFYPKYDREEILRILSERLRALDAKLPLIRVVLFGSYARGNYTVASDVDLLIVYEGKPRSDAYAIAKRILGIPRLEPHPYSQAQYEKMKRVISKMLEAGIVLYSRGQEE